MLHLVEKHLQSLLGKLYRAAKECAQKQREAEYRKGFKSIGQGVEMSGIRCSSCARISIGHHVYFGEETTLVGRGGIEVQDHVIMGPEVLVMSSMHRWRDADWVPYDNVEWLKPVVVGRACWLGYRAIVLPGVRLGPGTIVGAGAVVTKSFPAGAVVAGNPARQIGQRNLAQFEQCCGNGLFYLKLKQEQNIPLLQKQERILNPPDA